MPKIQEFDAGNLALRPTEIGVDATAAAARRIGAFYNQKGEALSTLGQRAGGAIRDAGDAAVSFMDHRQISAGAANGASLISDLNNQWNAATKTADPNDPSVANKFREEVLEPRLEQFKSGFTTEKSQAWAEHFVDGYRQHMFQKTAADMSSLAADAVHVNVEKTRNALVNATYNDPSTLDFARDALAHSLDGISGSSPNLTPEARSKVRQELTFKGEQELVHAAITGTIIKGGDWRAIANDPKSAPYINRPEIEQFERAEKAQKRADLLSQKQLEDYQHTQQVRDGQDKLGKAFTDNVTYDDQMRPIVKPGLTKAALEIASRNPTAADHARTLINWGEAQLRSRKESIVTDPATKKDLYDGLFRTENPTSEVALMKAQIDGKLSNQDFSQLHQLQKALEEKPLKGPLYQGTMEAVKGMLGVSVMPDGHERYGNFVQKFIPAYLGLPPEQQAKALNLKDPNSLINQSMAGIKPSQQQLSVAHFAKGVPADLLPQAFGGKPAAPGVPQPTPAVPLARSPAQASQTLPVVGDVRRGYRYNGGDPNDRSSWTKVAK